MMDVCKAAVSQAAKERRWWRGERARGVAVWVIALGWSSQAGAVGVKDLSLTEFRAEVTRLQGVVAGCAASAGACRGDRVGDDVRVGEGRGFEQRWDWMRVALEKAGKAKPEERAQLMREADGQLAELARESAGPPGAGEARVFGRARAEANAVLARAEFQHGGGPTWWDRAKAWMLGWLLRFFTGVARVGVAAPWLGTVLEWVCFVGVAVGLLFFLLRNVSRQRLRVSLGERSMGRSAWEREAEDWAAWAEEHAAAGEWREAVHGLYWAAIVLLEERRAWRHNPTRTPREYVRLLKAGTAQEQGLRRLTQIFERVWYGLREANAEEYGEARGVYEGLAKSGKDGAARATLSSGGAA